MFEENTINQNMSYQLKKETIYNTDFFPLSSGPMSHKNVQGKPFMQQFVSDRDALHTICFTALLKKRSGMISKCRHKNKFCSQSEAGSLHPPSKI